MTGDNSEADSAGMSASECSRHKNDIQVPHQFSFVLKIIWNINVTTIMRARTEYRYFLSRRERLLPHLRVWGLYPAIGLPALFVAVLYGIDGHWGGLLISILLIFSMRRFYLGLALIFFRSKQPMCIAIEEKGVGFGDTNPDWWIFLDGVVRFCRTFDIWTIQHHNGTLVHIPAKIISEEDVTFLKNKAARKASRE